MDILFVTALSVLLQCATAVLALRLIPTSRLRVAWVGISLAVLGIAFRRGLTLFRILIGETPQPLDLAYETIGLFTSLFLLVGIYYIAPIFESNVGPVTGEADGMGKG